MTWRPTPHPGSHPASSMRCAPTAISSMLPTSNEPWWKLPALGTDVDGIAIRITHPDPALGSAARGIHFAHPRLEERSLHGLHLVTRRPEREMVQALARSRVEEHGLALERGRAEAP